MWTPADPEHYLRRDFRGKASRGGTPLMSAGSSIFEPTSNWLIYGHNMFDGTMFHDLVKYKDESFYKTHPTIRFDTIYEGGKGTYQVIAVVKARQGGEASHAKTDEASENTLRGFDYEQFAGVSDQVNFARYVDEVKARSLYDTGHTAVFGDQLITLSTCEYSQKYGRLYVVAVRVYEN
ncbi:MAG: class B sortase [Eubacterium sp.]|nr:class B sortase [Candidatus Colimonas fimequi]